LVIVQRSVALVPAATPVTPLTSEVGVVITAAPLNTLHSPVPVPGTLPASVNELVLHCVISTPAADTVGGVSLVNVTSSKLLAHVPLLIVQRTTVANPAVTPVTVLLGEPGVVTAPGPL
jgi:hypothetical protein